MLLPPSIKSFVHNFNPPKGNLPQFLTVEISSYQSSVHKLFRNLGKKDTGQTMQQQEILTIPAFRDIIV